MTYTSIPTGEDPVVNAWLHELGMKRAKQWLKGNGAKTTEDDGEGQTHFVHGDNGESIKITVRWHYEGKNNPSSAPNVTATKELPSKVSHVLLVRTYFGHSGFDSDNCYFTFIPRTLP
jgi:hypothetical protein